jgi:hypothetical protein
MSVIGPWTPPTDREWTEAEHWRWTAEHHCEFRIRAEEERAALRQQLEGAVEAERARIVDDLRYGRKGMGDVVGPSIRNALADVIATAGER